MRVKFEEPSSVPGVRYSLECQELERLRVWKNREVTKGQEVITLPLEI